jgi:23S rRNA (cytosine1962-C5)-methyltransferase
MRTITLARAGANKLRAQHRELKSQDLEDSIKSLPPGEWCYLKANDSADGWVGYVNPLVSDKFASVQVVSSIKQKDVETFNVENFLKQTLQAAIERRKVFKGYEKGARLFYGSADGLTGLIVDGFENAIIAQINTSGIDRYRELIRNSLKELTSLPVFLLDNEKYREKEFLPTFEKEVLPDLSVSENELIYKLRSQVIQKVGFYYDHRENRLQLQHLLKRMNRSFERGVDLFCYAGAWGMNALAAGVKSVDFVDQGDFKEEVELALELNSFAQKGNFYRQDVFKFLDESLAKAQTFDVVLCDPPAFAKNATQKPQALEGYSKLHRRVIKSSSKGALIAFSSCTHYVSHEEFQKNIQDAAAREGRRPQLVYSGMQGFDHPVTSLDDRSNYIKSYFYIME